MKQENELNKAIESLSEAFKDIGDAIRKCAIEMSKRLQILADPIVVSCLMMNDDKLQLWYKQYETARGRKRDRNHYYC